MDRIKFVSELFSPPPVQWGYRGDPYLWNEMKDRSDNIPIPDNKSALMSLLIHLYESLTCKSFEKDDRIRIDRYPKNDMSGGSVSPKFWKLKGFPLLISRSNLPE